jgi:hypothetical protein
MAKGEKTSRSKKTAKKASSTRKKNAKTSVKSVHTHPKLPGSWRMAWQALLILKDFWRSLGLIILIFSLLNLVLASGLSAVIRNVNNLNLELAGGRMDNALAQFGSLAGGSGATGDSGSAVSSIIFIIASLAFIWALRQLLAGDKIKVKEAFYKGMAPLVPFIIILFVIILQLLPITITAALLGIIVSGAFGQAATVIFTILLFAAATWSLYMLASSVMALYISTLPDMQPLRALRSAKDLVRFRRLAVMRRLLMLPILMLLAFLLIFIPLLLIYPPVAAPLFFIAYTLAIFFSHTYLFNLYRWLLA